MGYVTSVDLSRHDSTDRVRDINPEILARRTLVQGGRQVFGGGLGIPRDRRTAPPEGRDTSVPMGRLNLPALLAVVALGGGGSGVSAFAPSIPGLARFSSAGPQTQARQTASFSLGRWAAQPSRMEARAPAVTSLTMVKNPDSIGRPIPSDFMEGTDYMRDGRGLAVGDLVMVQRSDGRCA